MRIHECTLGLNGRRCSSDQRGAVFGNMETSAFRLPVQGLPYQCSVQQVFFLCSALVRFSLGTIEHLSDPNVNVCTTWA